MINKLEIDIIAKRHVHKLEEQKLNKLEERMVRYTPIEIKTLINDKKDKNEPELNIKTLDKTDKIIIKSKRKILLETIEEIDSFDTSEKAQNKIDEN